jgi:Uma2 family endonuclease
MSGILSAFDKSAAERAAIHYPESDGAPLGESGIHVRALLHMLGELDLFFRHRPDVFVGGNQFIYYQEGEPKDVVCPDVYVVFDTHKAERSSWKTWVEGRFPHVVFEMTSPSSRWRDLAEKRGLYAELGVEEYFVFDPLREIGPPPLRGWRLRDGVFVAIEAEPHDKDVLRSERLGLFLREDGPRLRAIEIATGRPLLHWDEFGDALGRFEASLQRAVAQRDLAEASLQRAESERQSAEADRGRWQQENANLLAEIARLKAELHRSRPT